MGAFRAAQLTHELCALTGLWGTYLNSMLGVTAASLVSDGPLIDFWGQLAKAVERVGRHCLQRKQVQGLGEK